MFGPGIGGEILLAALGTTATVYSPVVAPVVALDSLSTTSTLPSHLLWERNTSIPATPSASAGINTQSAAQSASVSAAAAGSATFNTVAGASATIETEPGL